MKILAPAIFIALISSIAFADDLSMKSAVDDLVGTDIWAPAQTKFMFREGTPDAFLQFLTQKGIAKVIISQSSANAAERAEVEKLRAYCGSGDINRDAVKCNFFALSEAQGNPNGSKNWNVFDAKFYPAEQFADLWRPSGDQSTVRLGIASQVSIFDNGTAKSPECDEEATMRVWFDKPSPIAAAIMEYTSRDHVIQTYCYEVTHDGLKVKWIYQPELWH